MAAANEAVKDAALDMEKEDPYMVGVSIGSGIGSLNVIRMSITSSMKRDQVE